MNSQEEFQFMVSQLGDFGKYQFRQHVLHCLMWLLSAIHMMGFVFVFPIMNHRCFIEGIDEKCHVTNTTTLEVLENYIPKTEDGSLQSCFKFQTSDEGDNSSIISCGPEGYVYTPGYFQSSRVTEWDMICDRDWMRALLQATFLFGSLIGALSGGILADRFGRKPIICFSGILQFFWGFGVVFSDNYYACAFCIFMYGFFGSGTGSCPAVTLTMELVGPSKRTMCGILISCCFGLGGVIVAAWAYFLPGNARMLQLIYVSHSLILFGNWWLVDESFNWLWTQGKKEDAILLLQKAAKTNGFELICPPGVTTVKRRMTLADAIAKRQGNNKGFCCSPKRSGLFALFRTGEMRKRILVSMFTFFAAGALYYGLSFNSINLFGNPYLIFIMTCVADFPAIPIVILLTPKTGYKPMLCLFLMLPGVTCIVLAFINKNIWSTVIATLAKVSATLIFKITNAYTAELFPTVVRNTALGLCVMSTRLGGTAIPEINLLERFSGKLPNLVFGVIGLVAAGLVLVCLPETMNRPIPQTIEDVEGEKKKKKKGEQQGAKGESNDLGVEEDML
ncbi:unnamed protein product [Orchesella dallaii]|uniref:Organic cation transporter protein n=1 Tax=Orchesella dallaii TaxID=48710 RepID=A0ABP1Q252_9HEXA